MLLRRIAVTDRSLDKSSVFMAYITPVAVRLQRTRWPSSIVKVLKERAELQQEVRSLKDVLPPGYNWTEMFGGSSDGKLNAETR